MVLCKRAARVRRDLTSCPGGVYFLVIDRSKFSNRYQVQVLRTPVYSETDSRSRLLWMLLSMGLRPSSSSLPAMKPLELRRRRKESLKKAMLKLMRGFLLLGLRRRNVVQQRAAKGAATASLGPPKMQFVFQFHFISHLFLFHNRSPVCCDRTSNTAHSACGVAGN